MNKIIYEALNKLDLYDHLKIFKDKYFKSDLEKNQEKKRYEFYLKLIGKGNLCFDIGANYGNRTEIFLQLGAKVIAIEPQPRPLKFLKRKYNDKIVLIDKAIGAKPGKSKMFVSSAPTLTSMSTEWIGEVSKGRFSKATWNEEITVEVITLDELINKYGIPDFCKIDVEGFELEVLKGLTSRVKIISFEYTIPEFVDKAVESINHLNSLGKIVCNYSPGEALKFGLSSWLEPEAFISLFKKLPEEGIIDGDIYIKFSNNK